MSITDKATDSSTDVEPSQTKEYNVYRVSSYLDKDTVKKDWMGRVEGSDKEEAWNKAHRRYDGSVEVKPV